jgi:hypothetical protein
MVKEWLGISSIRTQDWAADFSIKHWWTTMACKANPNRKAMASLTMLVSWTIWKERNTRIFNNKIALPTILLEITKSEAKLWVAAGAKHLSFVMMGE